MVKSKIHIPKPSGISLEKINQDLVKCLGHIYEFSEDEGEVLLQHFCGDIEGDYKKRIVIQPIDGSLIIDEYVEMLNGYDLILTPSPPCQKIMEDCGVTTPIRVIPNWWDPEIFEEDNGYFNQLFPEKKYTFYSESGGYERKNIQLLVNGFLKTFAADEKVRLLVKCTEKNQDLAELKNLVKRTENPPEIVFIEEKFPEDDLRSLMRGADCYTCVSHVEGFCIPILNAAVLGKDIIATDSWMNGYLGFLDSDTALLLRTKPMKMALSQRNMMFYHKDAVWERPLGGDFRQALRKCFEGSYPFVKGRVYPEYSREAVMNLYHEVLQEALQTSL